MTGSSANCQAQEGQEKVLFSGARSHASYMSIPSCALRLRPGPRTQVQDPDPRFPLPRTQARTMGSVPLRSQSPDVTVAVGRGDARQEFQCYTTVLALASPYFDAMFCADMREKSSGFVEFPDKDPEEWKLFYQFVSPGRVLNISEETVLTLAPWFHEFQMEACLGECDEAISAIVKNISNKTDSFWAMQGRNSSATRPSWLWRVLNSAPCSAPTKGRGGSALEERKVAFHKIIDLLCFACAYDHEPSQDEAELALRHLMTSLRGETADLFDVGVIEKLLDLTLPLEGATDEHTGKMFFRSKGKSTVFWDCVKEHVCDEELTPLLLEAVNDKPALHIIIHAYFCTFRLCFNEGFSGDVASVARAHMNKIRDDALAKHKEDVRQARH